MVRRALLVLGFGLLGSLTLSAEETIHTDINWKIRQEGTENSQVLRTLHFLTDVYGPRLTGSPNLKAAGEWAIRQMESWGMKNGHLEPWDWGHPGWMNEKFSGHIIAPVKDHLTCEVVAWTPSTSGTVSGQVVVLEIPSSPTKETLTSYLDSVKSTVRGKMVFMGKPATVPVVFFPSPLRREDSQVREQFDPENATPQRLGPQRPQQPQDPREGPRPLSRNQITEMIDQFLLANGALVKIDDAGRAHGQIRAFGNRTYDPDKAVPAVVMRNEDYGRIWRIMADGTPVELEFQIVNRIYPEGATAYNAIAEIPGSDREDEVVMLGGHLDSWHSGTGATDNATGVTMMMEAARILQAVGARPRRTVRVALWGGEEQGLLGSQAYVAEHFGTFEEPKAEFSRLVAYFNIDSGTGRARGASVFGPDAAAAVLREILKSFEDLGVMGARSTDSRRRGGTDSTSFNAAGLPGIGLSQDPIEYGTHTWHTGLDNYERAVEEDLRASAIVIASAVYHLANRDEMLPRFGKDEMPKPPATSQTGTQ